MPSSRQMTTRAVASFDFYTANEQSWKLNVSACLSKTKGNTLSLYLSFFGIEFPSKNES